MLAELQKKKRGFKIEKCIILGMHKTKGFIKGKIVFPNEDQAHKHWKICEYAKKVNDYKFYIVMPVSK